MKVRYIKDEHRVPIKMWTDHVKVEDQALEQADNLARLPFIFKNVALMPDVHKGFGSTVGSVIPTKGAIIPAAVGVDIGCGMMAYKTIAKLKHFAGDLKALRASIEAAVPHGRSDNGGLNDVGSWRTVPRDVGYTWTVELSKTYDRITEKHPAIAGAKTIQQLGTLGGGNHFIELCSDENEDVWVMLHSGSRGVGNIIGRYFTELAKRDMERFFIHLPDADLAYLPEGTEHFDDYIEAMLWAQTFARENRKLMMNAVGDALRRYLNLQDQGQIFEPLEAINCHHNYATKEHHYNQNVWVTRKGAVCARKGVLGIIPGSMGAKSYIVKGLGNPESFMSCSHGAGRSMSRTEARNKFTVEDLESATVGIECPKDSSVLDETPQAYKDIDDVMRSQRDLVEVVHTLKQFVNIKGGE